MVAKKESRAQIWARTGSFYKETEEVAWMRCTSGPENATPTFCCYNSDGETTELSSREALEFRDWITHWFDTK